VFIGRDWGQQRNYSESLAAKVDDEVQRILDEQHDRATKAIGEDLEALDRVAAMLIKRERVTGEEFAAIYRGEEESVVFAAADAAVKAKQAEADESKAAPAEEPVPAEATVMPEEPMAAEEEEQPTVEE